MLSHNKKISICWALETSDAKWHNLDIFVCNGTNNYVNYFWSNLKINYDIFGDKDKYQVGFPMQLHESN